jgi:hypothetical protein
MHGGQRQSPLGEQVQAASMLRAATSTAMVW